MQHAMASNADILLPKLKPDLPHIPTSYDLDMLGAGKGEAREGGEGTPKNLMCKCGPMLLSLKCP